MLLATVKNKSVNYFLDTDSRSTQCDNFYINLVLDSGSTDDVTDVTTPRVSDETASFAETTSSANSASRSIKKVSSKLIKKARLIVDQSKVAPGGKVGIKHKPMSHVISGK